MSHLIKLPNGFLDLLEELTDAMEDGSRAQDGKEWDSPKDEREVAVLREGISTLRGELVSLDALAKGIESGILEGQADAQDGGKITVTDTETRMRREMRPHEQLLRVTVELLNVRIPIDLLTDPAASRASALAVIDWTQGEIAPAAQEALDKAVEELWDVIHPDEESPWTDCRDGLPDDDILVIGCNAETDTQWFVKRVEGRWLEESGVSRTLGITHWMHLDPCPMPWPPTPRND